MFERLIGNEKVKATLGRLLKSGRFPQSSIFAGPNGIGKKQFALEIAKATVCAKPVDSAPCQNCSPCQRATRFSFPNTDKKEDYERVFLGEHPDIGIVLPNKNVIYVDAIRDLEIEANFRPYESTSRFFIIDDAEKMAQATSNALLKTLEEPAETTFIFLITSAPASLLPTIRSRSQTIQFSPVEDREIVKYLDNEKNYPSADSTLVASISQGSIGKALKIDPPLFKEQRLNMLRALESLAAGNDFATLLRTSEEISRGKSKEEFEDRLAIFQTLVHDT